mgnify:FL=1|jgi:xanthine dehydrogenase accessory factor|tara:strand:+ start:1570 stop:2499 length:930 start_codon:yes stop_codon:yes gene_type:complete
MKKISTTLKDPLKYLVLNRGSLVLVTDTEGASYRDIGTFMSIGADGTRIGSVSSGCIEDDIAGHAQQAIVSGKTQTLRYGLGSPFFDLRLPCGGGLSIVVIPNPDEAVLAKALHKSSGRLPVTLSFDFLTGEINIVNETSLEVNGTNMEAFKVTLLPDQMVYVFGQGAEARSFAQLSNAAGYRVKLFTKDENFESILGVKHIRITDFDEFKFPEADPWTAICLFFHDHENEAKILANYLGSLAALIGVQGSQKSRITLLMELQMLGVPKCHVDKLAHRFGLIPKCRDPQTLAISVLAHVATAFEEQRLL